MRLAELAQRLGGRSVEGDGGFEVRGIASLEEGGEGDLGFVRSPAQAAALASSAIGALVAPAGVDTGGRPVIRSLQPSLDFARAAGWLRPPWRPEAGVHATAQVEPGARLGEGVHLGPYVVVGEGARVGPGSVLHAHVTLYPRARVGADCVLHAGSVVREECRLGDRVVLQPGAVIGGDGFGFDFDENGRLEKIPQVGSVVLGDDVEVGANTTVDRARLGATRVGDGVKLDNLVQIGHGCVVGNDSAIVAQSGIAGGTRLGRRVFMLSQSGVANRASVGDGAVVTARSGVHRDVEPGERVWGYPILPGGVWHRSVAWFARLPELARRLRAVERRLERESRGEEPG